MIFKEKEYSLVGVAGTFAPLHIGHKNLFRKAFEVSKKVMIGITDDKIIKGKEYADKIAPYSERKEKIKEFLKEEGYLERATFIKLNDPYGPAIEDSGLEAIVLSEETSQMEEKINDIRKSRDLKPLDFITVKLILAEDGKRISSTRIRKKEIDCDGNILR